MRKILLTALLVSGGLTASAQYLPNEGFENWKGSEKCGNSYQTSNPAGERQRPGDEPSEWNGSSVNQQYIIEKKETLVFKQNNTDRGNYTQLINKEVGATILGRKIAAVAPGFLTFSTPWVYATYPAEKSDGGSYGGKDFTYRPDAIKGLFKRTKGDDVENARIIAYLWNGTFKSTITGDKNVEDEDRVVLGKKTATGGTGKLIASCDYSFSSTKYNDWEEIVVPINYNLTDVAPTKMNVIISSADYWTRSNMKNNSTLEVDDVQFVYYHALTSVTYKGTFTYNLKEGQTECDIEVLPGEEINLSDFDFVKKGVGATIDTPVYNANAKTVTVTVKGNDYDKNANSKTVYTFHLVEAQTNTYYNDITFESKSSASHISASIPATIQLVKVQGLDYAVVLKDFYLPLDGTMTKAGTLWLLGPKINGNEVSANTEGNYFFIDNQPNFAIDAVKVDLTGTLNGNLSAIINIDGSEIGSLKCTFAPTVEINGTTDLNNIEQGLKNIHFSRPLKAGWSTICLPFDYTAEALTGNWKAVAQQYSDYSNNELHFNSVNEMEANMPYLIYSPEAVTETYFAAEIVAAEPRAICHGGFCFQGNYTPSFAMANRYGVADHGTDGQFIQKGGEGSTLPATGAYFTGSGKPQSVRLNLGGDVTGISGNVVNDSNASAPVYDLKGVRVSNGSLNGLPKGLYIQGGKKVYVK